MATKKINSDSESVESRVDKLTRRELLSCSYCKPHRNENAGRRPKHGIKKKHKKRNSK